MQNPLEKPIPSQEQPILQAKAFAADLAYGALNKMWETELPSSWSSKTGFGQFLVERWNNNFPEFNLLVSLGYLKTTNRLNTVQYILTQKAFDLLETIPTDTKVFISYGRQEGSTFSLALQYKLSHLNVSAFLDRELELGEEWHAKLETVIKNCDYFIVLLAPNTLESKFVRKEINWAFEAKRSCIPVWYADFSQQKHLDNRKDIHDEVKNYIGAKNACIVEGKQKAAIYHDAITRIVNRLGYTEV
jgi:hypothetical protein